MKSGKQPIYYLLILALLISFGSIGAVAFTPGLVVVAKYFNITRQLAETTVTWYLMGYALGQLLYGPIMSQFGSRKTIALGAIIEIIGALSCAFALPFHSFTMLVVSRFIMGLGGAVGGMMTMTIASHLYPTNEAARVMGLLTMAFAITPALGVFIGGILVTNYDWAAPFYFMALYGIAILLLSKLLPGIYSNKSHPMRLSNILQNYALQLKNISVFYGGLLVGLGTSISYIFVAFAPFISMNVMHLNPNHFGAYNFISSAGIVVGSLGVSFLGKYWGPNQLLKFGLNIILVGSGILLLTLNIWQKQPLSLFLPMMLIYFGLSFIFGTSSALALHNAYDKGNASAMMSFINMGFAFLMVSLIGLFKISSAGSLPVIFLLLIAFGYWWARMLINHHLKLQKVC